MKALIVVDMQNDFIDGALGTPEAEAIVDNVKTKISHYRQNSDIVIFTRDTHGEKRGMYTVGTLYVWGCEIISKRWKHPDRFFYLSGCSIFKINGLNLVTPKS